LIPVEDEEIENLT